MPDAGAKPAAPPALEVQIHPADIRYRVLYFFLTRRQVTAAVVGAMALGAFLLLNFATSPWVVSGLLHRREYDQIVADRTRHGERLLALTERFGELRVGTEQLHLQMSRIYLAYGLGSAPSVGQGGYPFAAPPAPESIYAGQIQRGAALEARVREQLNVLDTFLGEVQRFEADHRDQVLTTPSTSPLRGEDYVLTSPFGTRRSPFTKALDLHAGIDLAAPVGTPIHAPADGTVVFAGRYPLRQSVAWWRYGNLIAIRHGERFVTLFGHCDEIHVRNGQEVRQGEVLASVGNTGWSTSPHLHYEVRSREPDGRFVPVDPRIYILDHRWRDEERMLVRARSAPEAQGFEPLPQIIGR